MILIEDKITEIFCSVDDFCNEFNSLIHLHSLKDGLGKPKRNRRKALSTSEVITIMICFHLGSFRNMKHYYINYVQKHLKSEFPKTVSYNRFVELMQESAMPMALFLKLKRMGLCTGIGFIDSTVIKVCKNQRIHNHKVFANIAERGKGTMGWFYGFKLHLAINDKGELLGFFVTPGNVDDRNLKVMEKISKNLWGKLFGDRGYISKTLFEFLFLNGIHLVTKIRNNMKNSLMSIADKVTLRKRAIIESVNDELKNICQIEHSRHRSIQNFFTNMMSALIAYTYFDKKPSIKYVSENSNQLNLFYA